jgi:hypothetical protein
MVHEEDETPFDRDDEPPWATPENQSKYEAALGPFIVEYNRLDHMLGDMLGRMMLILKRGDLAKRYEKRADLWFKLEMLDVLASTKVEAHLGDIPVAEIREIHKKRNLLVHSHYDGNPFDYSYVLIPQGRKGRVEYLSPEEVSALVKQIESICERIRHAQVVLAFMAHDAEKAVADPPHA